MKQNRLRALVRIMMVLALAVFGARTASAQFGKIDGKVMEVLKYIKSNLVEVKWFDLESKEVRTNKVKEDKLSKAA